jgi:hypothetical protein
VKRTEINRLRFSWRRVVDKKGAFANAALTDHPTGIAGHLPSMRGHPRVSFPAGFDAHRVALRKKHDLRSDRCAISFAKNRFRNVAEQSVMTIFASCYLTADINLQAEERL